MSNQFPYEVFSNSVESWLEGKEYWCCWAVWERIKGTVRLNANIDYGYDLAKTPESREVALGFAWEDLVNAFCGCGTNHLNGLVADLFFAMPKPAETWPVFSAHVTKAVKDVEGRLEINKYPRRYRREARDRGCISGPTNGAFRSAAVQEGGYPYAFWEKRFRARGAVVQAIDTNVIRFPRK